MPLLTRTSTSTSEEYTAVLAGALAALLQPGDVLTLEGELGAGKTTFTRALATALRVDPGVISSPTYVFVHGHDHVVKAGAEGLAEYLGCEMRGFATGESARS